MHVIITKDKRFIGEGYIKNPPLHSDRDFYNLDIGETNEIHFYEKEDEKLEYERYLDFRGVSIEMVMLYTNYTTEPITSCFTINKTGIQRILELSEKE